MDIYTAQYKYNGNDRLDITVKGNTYPGNVLAPKWEMVRGLQAQTISQWEYTTQWFSLIAERFYYTPDATISAFQAIVANRESLTLVCYCPANEFCHRVLAANMLQHMGLGTYRGERVF